MSTIDFTRDGPGVVHRDATADLNKLVDEIRKNPFALLCALAQDPDLVRRTVEHLPKLRKQISDSLSHEDRPANRPKNPPNVRTLVRTLHKYVSERDPGHKASHYYRVVADIVRSQPLLQGIVGELSEDAIRHLVDQEK